MNKKFYISDNVDCILHNYMPVILEELMEGK